MSHYDGEDATAWAAESAAAAVADRADREMERMEQRHEKEIEQRDDELKNNRERIARLSATLIEVVRCNWAETELADGSAARTTTISEERFQDWLDALAGRPEAA